jgi:hypothetical protein
MHDPYANFEKEFPDPGETDTGFLARLQAVDPEAWETMGSKYAPAIYAWCRLEALRPEDAQDVTQEGVHSHFAGRKTPCF